jgi:RHS repeat-associated protein
VPSRLASLFNGKACSAFSSPFRLVCVSGLAIVVLALIVASASVAAPSGAIRYAYDDAGRLKSVVDPATQTAIFKWDIVGNLLSTTRRASSTVQVLQATPSRGRVGTSVQITGTGFAGTATQNTVKFNGTTTAVLSATATDLLVKVPSGATSGTISVVAPGGTGTSDEPFTVTSQPMPVITDATPRLIDPGAPITITGSGFAGRLDTVVMFNKTPGFTNSSTATSINASVPTRAGRREPPGSGSISVVTPDGMGTGPDVFIPPLGFSASQVDATGRMQIGQSRTVSLPNSGLTRVGLVVFEGTAGQRVSVVQNTFNNGATVRIQHPGGRILGSDDLTQQGDFLEPVELPDTGTYTLVITAGGGGSIGFDLVDVPADVVDTVGPTPGGTTKSLTTTVAGQNAVLRFQGSAGQRIAFRTNSFSGASPMCAYLRRTGGTTVIERSCGSGDRFYGPVILPADGTYEIVYDPSGSATFTVSSTAYDVPPDAETAITPTDAGGSATATNSYPGQDVLVRFDGHAGERIALKVNAITGYASGKVSLSIRGPGGGQLNQPIGLTPDPCCSWLEPVTLPVDGEYTILVDPWDGADVGSAQLTAFTVAPDTTGSVSPSATGQQVTTSTTVAGQNSRLTFASSAGQRIALVAGSSTYSAPVCLSVLVPGEAEPITNGCYSGAEGWEGPITLSAAGESTIVVDPQGEGTGSFTMTVYDIQPNPTATLVPSASGDTATLTTTAPGQAIRFNFQGTNNDKIAYRVNAETFPDYPDSAMVSLQFPSGPGTGHLLVPGFWQEPVTLTSTGPHGVNIDPTGLSTGSATVSVFKVPADATAAIPGIGQSTALSTSTPGQNGRFTFTANPNQDLDVQTDSKTYPSGGLKLSVGTPSDNCRSLAVPTTSGLIRVQIPFGTPSNATYCVGVDPQADATGTINLTVWNHCCRSFAAALNSSDALASSTAAGVGEPPLPPSGDPTVDNDPEHRRTRTTGRNATERLGGRQSQGTLLGLVTTANGRPVAGAPVRLGRHAARTDEDGRFQLRSLSAGRQTLQVGDVAFAQRRRFAPTAHQVTISKGHELRLTSALLLPPLEQVHRLYVTLPLRHAFEMRPAELAHLGIAVGPRTRIAGRRRAGALAIDLARLRSLRGLTAPRGASGALYIANRDSATLTHSLKLVLPNTTGALAGTEVALLRHTVGKEGWRQIGLATVTPDGKSVSAARLRDFAPSIVALRRTGDSSAPRPTRSRPLPRRNGPSLKADRSSSAFSLPSNKPTTNGVSRSSLRRFRATGSDTWRPTRSNRDGLWYSKRRPSPWQLLPALEGLNGQTALAGQALKLNGLPLAGVTMRVEGTKKTASTDRTGRFLIEGVESGHQVLVIDGGSTGDSGVRYGRFEVGVDLEEGKTEQLGYTIWMPRLVRAGAVKVQNPTTDDMVVTTPHIPGLEVHVPAGSRIRGADGKPVNELGITPIPVDRPPFPLPGHVEVPIYFTVQPGGAYLSKGARIIYPNYNHLPAGQRVAFWNYDPDGRGWHIYGHGSVTENAEQVVPDPGVRIWELTGAMITSTPTPPSRGPTSAGAGGGVACCDPVDLASGLFVYKKTDLSIPDSIPINLTRTYRPGDANSYAFGIGAANPYDLRLWSINNYQDADLILPDGGRVHYVRTSPGNDYYGARYISDTTPGAFYKSTLGWEGTHWALRLRDGTIYGFGDMAPLVYIRDRYGNMLDIEREGTNEFGAPVGKITRINAPHGRFMKFTYDTSNRVTQAYDNAGRTVNYTYNTAGRLATAKDPNGGITTYTYDASGQMTAIKDPRLVTYVTNTYDATGRVSKQTMGDGGIYTFAYTLDANGKVTKTRVTDPLNRIRDISFNAAGYPTADTDAVGTPIERNTSYQRIAGTNLLSSATDELNRTTGYEYDAVGNVTKVIQMAGTSQERTTSMTYELVPPGYDDGGSNTYRLTSITDPLAHVKTYGYDATGRLTTIRDATNRETVIGYAGPDRLPTSVTDPLGKVTKYDYNDGGDIASITDPLGNKVSVFLDGAGRAAATTDALGRSTKYTYDAGDRLTKVVDASGQTTLFEHDPNGNLTKVTDPRLKTRVMTYDSMDRIATVADGLNRIERYDYDQLGNLTKLTDRKAQITSFAYDALNRRSFAGFGTVSSGGKNPTFTYGSTINYTWDGGDRLVTAADSVAGSYSNVFDVFDRLASQTGPTGTIAYGYDGADRRTSMTTPGQSGATYGYDSANRLTNVTRGAETVTMGYDGAGRRSSITLPNGMSENYAFDDASRLSGITYKLGQSLLGDINYELDPLSRRTATWGTYARTALPPAMASATYDNANQRITQDGATLTYDANGNLTKDASAATFTWNSRNQMATLTKGTTTGSFSYDPFGRRKTKTFNGTATSFLHDGQNIVQEQRAGNATANLLTGLSLDSVFSRTTAAGTSTLLHDGSGSTLALGDSLGWPGTSYTYDPFGSTTQTGAANDNPYQYTGRENDGTGFYHYRARYLHPGMGRFASPDPIGLSGGDINLYSYVGNDPVNSTDPLGLFDFGDLTNPIEPGGFFDLGSTSEFAAGALDGFLAGLPSAAAGVDQDCWGAAHNAGQLAGAAGGAAFTGGGTAALLAGESAQSIATAGMIGGAVGGLHQTAGLNPDMSLGEAAAGMLPGLAGGALGTALIAYGAGGNASAQAIAATGAAVVGTAADASWAVQTGGGVGVTARYDDSCG